ncbi:MAG: MucR family transcriptional regulator [Rhizobium sp.]|nr:MucR family transcriptional regulator [Rhizobium sp.]
MVITSPKENELQLVEYTSQVISAYVSNHVVPLGELPKLIDNIFSALKGASQLASPASVVEKPKPPVPVRKSIEADYLICLEDGRKFKSLKRHLKTSFNMTPEQYREKWDLPPDYPMVAPAYAAARSRLAKDMGLGKIPRKRVMMTLGKAAR